MLKTGILNPQINSLLSRVRQTNTLVIADRGFPFGSMIEMEDIFVADDLRTVLQLLKVIRPNFPIGNAWMAQEFLKHSSDRTHSDFPAAGVQFALHHSGAVAVGNVAVRRVPFARVATPTKREYC